MKFSTVPLGRNRARRVWAVAGIAVALSCWAMPPAFAQDHRDDEHHDEHHDDRHVERPVVVHRTVVRRDYRPRGYDYDYYQQPVYAPPVVYEPEPPSVGVNLIIPFHF